MRARAELIGALAVLALVTIVVAGGELWSWWTDAPMSYEEDEASRPKRSRGPAFGL